MHPAKFPAILGLHHPTLDRNKKTGISAKGDTENVRDEEVRRRLKYIRARLLRAIWGNHWQGKGQIMYLVFRQGRKKSYNVHYHALMAIVGKHDWSDEAVEMAIQSIEKNRRKRAGRKRQRWIVVGTKGIRCIRIVRVKCNWMAKLLIWRSAIGLLFRKAFLVLILMVQVFR
jgi:hypothetical protein